MKVKIPMHPKCTAAMNKEINSQIIEQNKKYELDLESMILWTYRQETGSGKIKLERFYKRFISEYERFKELFEMDDCFPERKELEKIGVYVEELKKKYGDKS